MGYVQHMGPDSDAGDQQVGLATHSPTNRPALALKAHPTPN